MTEVRKLWQEIYNLQHSFLTDGSSGTSFSGTANDSRSTTSMRRYCSRRGMRSPPSPRWSATPYLFMTLSLCRRGGSRAESTVAQQRAEDIHLVKAKTEEGFVALRVGRDRNLPMPELILHSLQVNIRGGPLPDPESNGKRYLKIPLDALEGAPWDD